MRSRKNVAILFLSLTTVTAATVAWQQYQELSQLRVAVAQSSLPSKAAASFVDPSANLAEDVTEDVTPVTNPDESEASPTPQAVSSTRPRGDRRNGPGADFRAMMEHPEIQRLIAIQQKSALDSRYSDLFRNLSLSSDQLERFKELLVEKRTAVSDVRSAARETGVNARNDPATIAKLVAGAQAEIDQDIRETLGESGYAKYKNYEQTQSQRNMVNQLERRLSYSSTPLSSQQTDQMVAILAVNSQSNPTQASGLFGPRGAPNLITDATINQALGVLAAPQIDALRQLQQEQQAQSALNAAMRQRSQSNRNTSPSGAAPSASNAVTTPQPPAPSGS